MATGGFGDIRGVSWSEVRGYMAATLAFSEPWEARAIVSMSRAFAEGLRDNHPSSRAPEEQETGFAPE